MKKSIALLLALVLLVSFGGCQTKEPIGEMPSSSGKKPATQQTEAAENGGAAETAAPETTSEPTTEPTTVPTEPPVYRNPLSGEIVDEPFTDRIYASVISNMQENLPHVNLVKADVVMEMYVNMNNIVRCLALFSDIESVEAVGSTRSTRPMFNDIAQHYDLILAHAGGSDTALSDARNRGIENFNIENWDVMKVATTSYRDQEYKRSLENSLFGIGSGYREYAEASGFPMTLEKDYGFRFTEDGTPEYGEDAQSISITLQYKQAKKETVMVYDEELGKYVWNQYGKAMQDQITEEEEAFTNVIVMFTEITNQGIYHYADFNAGGSGYYANGGKIIPIFWGCDGDKEAFHFLTEDAQDLEIGVGNTYIAICPIESPVAW